ncbi:MAG: DUF87 domain-containing protein [Anaerolineae bacterium]|nr:DUF87 domain-containing protein [Anaerolineae bacterium]MCX8067427.1 DUF87 domain-containing protein [Anaerolineae bacterium]MDW7990945.1 DUF87 domain-containing protein [Anaerolineae bacterium]
MTVASFPADQFYLGREYDPTADRVTDRPVFYPPRHLTTHAIILGMTGSGKTGLGIVLLEEALLAGIPILAVDPKGDLANLLLTFPDLRPEDFAPWVDTEMARRKGRTPEEVAAEEAKRWREGLAQWDIGPDRIARLRQAAEFLLFTPGSTAGLPLNVLSRFAPPEVEEDEESRQERVSGLVSALLGLAGREADPLQSPDHIFLSLLVEHLWRSGEPVDLPTLVRLVQDPPVRQVGVFDLESFFPQRERFALARALNGILAAPGFAAWREGMPLEIGTLLRAPDGRPRASLFYLAHLEDAERAFFITLLLEAVRDWMADQPGTSNLRALLYFDEVYGYFPPYPSNPPTKRPLMMLVKQGRAAGLGVVLATQNPADLDYKGLTNAGTWAVGLLRTERDKARVLEGLEGAASAMGAGLDRAGLDRAISGLRPRVFLWHDVRAGKTLFLQTRWAMSYLCGPLTRAQIRQLVAAPPPARPEERGVARAEVALAPASRPTEARSHPPTLPPDIPQAFLPAAVTLEWALRRHEERSGQAVLATDRRLVYLPRLLAMGTVYLNNERIGLRHTETVVRLVEAPSPPVLPEWGTGEIALGAGDLSHRPPEEGVYGPLPAHMAQPAHYARWSRSFAEFLYRETRLTLWYNRALKLYSRPGESAREFRRRCEEVARARRDEEAARVRASYERQMARIQEKLRREEQELAQDQAELEARKREELLSYGEAALNLFTRRRPSYMISHVSRKRRLTQQAEAEVQESVEAIRMYQEQLEDLAARWEEEAAALNERWAATLEQMEEVEVAPRRGDIAVDFCGLVWVPFWEVGTKEGARLLLPAHPALE